MAGFAIARPDAAMADANPVGFLVVVVLLHLLFFFSPPFELTMDTESESLPPGLSILMFRVCCVCVRLIPSKMGLCGGLAVNGILVGDSEMGDIPDKIPDSSPPEDEVVGVMVSKLVP